MKSPSFVTSNPVQVPPIPVTRHAPSRLMIMSPKPLLGRRLRDIHFSSKYPSINARTVVAPIVAFTMAGILFVYTRSSIYAAKRNASRHREVDGGQISWRNESQRRHGALTKPQERLTLKSLLTGGNKEEGNEPRMTRPQASREEEAVMARRIQKGGGER